MVKAWVVCWFLSPVVLLSLGLMIFASESKRSLSPEKEPGRGGDGPIVPSGRLKGIVDDECLFDDDNI